MNIDVAVAPKLYILKIVLNNFIINNAHFLKRCRNIRNESFNKTDKYVLCDFPITLEKQMIIKAYRQN